MPTVYGQTSSTIWGPRLITRIETCQEGIEVSLHTLPRPLLREFHHVFPEGTIPMEDEQQQDGGPSQTGSESQHAELLAVPTNQHAREDLVSVGDKIEREKDRLLNIFMSFAQIFCKKVRDAGFWADFIDPCSGLPMLTVSANKVYSEVDGMECCLGYKSYNAGFCKILTHPVWGSSVYPATMFCYAPRSFLMDLLEEYPMLNSQQYQA